MECEHAQELLWPPEEPKAADPHVIEARRHVSSCEECRRFFRRDRLLGEQLRALPLPPAPPHVRARVYSALEEERERGEGRSPSARGEDEPRAIRWLPRSTVSPMAAAAILAFLLVGGWFVVDGPGWRGLPSVPGAGEDGDMVLVENFVREAVQQERIITSDPGVVTGFLNSRLGFDVTPDEFDGFQLVGAEICVWGGKRGAVILYERNGQMLYHYVLRGEDPSSRAPRISSATPTRWAGRSTPSTAIWSSELLDQALVGDLDAATLLVFAGGASGARPTPPS